MIKFIKKNPAIPQRWIVLTALAYSLTAAQEVFTFGQQAFSLVHYGIYQTTQATKLCKTLP